MENTTHHIEASLKTSYSYQEYGDLIQTLLDQEKSTTENGSEILVYYSGLNMRRMHRWDRKFKVEKEHEEIIKAFDKERIWIVISEGWCGDAAHSLPVIHKMATLNDKINLRIVLREQNLELMNDFRTNGSRSIPKLIIYDPKTKTIEGTWGPRPAGAVEIFNQFRDREYEVLEKELQLWYNKDKGNSTAAEVVTLLLSSI